MRMIFFLEAFSRVVILIVSVVFFFSTFCLAGSIRAKSHIAVNDIIGMWTSAKPGKVLHCYLDDTILLKTGENRYFRGNFVFQSGRKPLFFLLIHNHRISCPFKSLQDKILFIGGDTELAGQWIKKNNDGRGNW